MRTFTHIHRQIYAKVKGIIEEYINRNDLECSHIKVLDAAAGGGRFTSWLLGKGFSVTPIDIDVSHWQVPEIKCRQYDLNLPLPPFDKKTFDIVVSIETIEHLENPFHILREFSKVLKPNGLLIITTPNIHCAKSRFKYFILGLPTIFDYSKNEVTHPHISPVNIGQFLYSFDKNDMTLAGIYSINNMAEVALLCKIGIKSLNIFTQFVIEIIKKTKRYSSTHYIYRLSRKQIKQLIDGVILLIVARKKET